MTIFGWDASHYDGTLSTAILSRAKAEGITFFTHKVGEGTSYDDPNDATALACARDAGIEFVGGYFVPRSTSAVGAQVDYLLRLADRDEPWWRTFPGWFWQVDLERWPYDNVSASIGIAFARELRQRTGRWTILYASNGQYDGSLTGWDGPLWNAHYTSRGAAGFASMYPGDQWKPVAGAFVGGWAAYSGHEPLILQYTSSAIVAGLTTCDANAFRGTAADLRALIEGAADMEQGEAVIGAASRHNSVGDTLSDATNLRDEWYHPPAVHSLNPPLSGSRFDLLMQAVAKISNIEATVNSLALAGIDVAALANVIATAVIAHHDALVDSDRAVISAAVLDALRAGTGVIK